NFFVFSSRRRHTRWPRDWSSDVCSSDLWAWYSARATIRLAQPMFSQDCYDPNFAEGHNNLGLVRLQAGDISTAEAEFAEAVRLKPLYAEAHYNLALALHRQGKEAESRAEFERAFEISPELRNASRP